MTTQSLESKSLPQPSTNGWFTLRTILFASIVFGLAVSGYLSYIKFTATPSVCIQGGPFNCNVVLNSLYSEFLGIPIAYLGFALYVVLGILLLFQNRIGLLREQGNLIIFGLSVFGWVFSMWLVYVQFFILESLCPWCLSHEANFTVFFFVACLRLYRDMTGKYDEEQLETV